MKVRMDSPNKLQKYKSTKSTKKYISTKVLITPSFFEPQTPYFAYKFICTVQPNEKVQKIQKYKNRKVQKYKIEKYKNKKAHTKSLDTAIVSCLLTLLVLKITIIFFKYPLFKNKNRVTVYTITSTVNQ